MSRVSGVQVRKRGMRWVLAAALTLYGCGPQQQDQRLDFYAFGTEISVTLYSVTAKQTLLATEQLQSHYADVGHNWYPWRRGELHAINTAMRSGSRVDVSPRLAGIIRRAAEFELISGGRFNAGLGRLTELWGLHEISATPSALPDNADIAAILADRPGAVRIDWDQNRAGTRSDFVMLDLGGIAKGAILEDSVTILRELGITDAIINIGGDLTVLGNVRGRPARIGIRSPSNRSPIASLSIDDGETVVTSGIYERFVEIDGRRYAHILDPATGYPVDHSVSATIVHVDPVLADAAATALIVGGADEFDALTRAFGIDVALLIDSSGDVRLTQSMRERLHWIE